MTAEVLTPPAKDAATLHASLDEVQGQLVEFDKISAGLAALEQAHPKNVACDVATPAGMRQAIAGRAAWRDPRVALEKARKAAKAPVLALGRDIDAFARGLETKLLEGESHYDDQIKVEERRREGERQSKIEAERVRVQTIRDRITRHFTRQPMLWIGGTVEQLAAAVDAMAAIDIDDSFAELRAEAETAREDAAEALWAMHAKQVRADQAAAEAAAQAEAARIERERVAAEQKAEAERLAAERAKFEAEQQRQALAAAAERKRIADEAAAAKAIRDKADDEARAKRADEDRLAREARAAEDKRIADARAKLETEQRAAREAEDARAAAARKAAQDRLDEEAAARREAEEAAHAAEQRGRDAWRELLAALRWCVENDGGECLGDHPARLAQARAAIALAIGEQA